jgi:hypothetical protein
MYFIERGRFNTDKGYWERPYRYQCDVAVRAGAEGAAFTRDTLSYDSGSGNTCEVGFRV